jgi:CRP/FNR family nitrogen fixation transcriptional regulator
MLTQFNHDRVTTGMTRRDPAVHSLLTRARPCALSFYPPNGMIYAQGEPVGPLYLVEFGTVRICRLTADGRRQVSAFHMNGDVFGFEPGREHENYAECVDRAGIRLLRPGSDRGLDADLLAIALRTLARTQDHLMVLGRMSASERLAAFLLDLHERGGASRVIDLPMQRHDIADYLCLTIETVSRVLRIFKDTGMIRLPGVSQVEVLDLAGLQHLAP